MAIDKFPYTRLDDRKLTVTAVNPLTALTILHPPQQYPPWKTAKE
jgi:hypothetical protein